MPFIGKSPSEGKNNILLDAITTSATATYNLTKDSVAYSPISAQSLLVSLNGVTQAPISAYTVSGSQIIFDSALTTSDRIDYIIASTGPQVKTTIDAGSISTSSLANASVTTDKLAANSVTSDKIGVDVIVAEDLAANSITVSELSDSAVNEAKLNVSNAGSNGQFLQKQSGNTGGLTWADATLWTATTEGMVTTTSAQDNIDFTIPADANRIKVMFWSLSQVANDAPFMIRVGTTDGTVHTTNYKNTSWYIATSAQNLTENTDGIKLNGWNATSNYWYGSLNMECFDTDKRRWFYHWNPYNDTYGEYQIGGNGKLDNVASGQQVRKIRFTCTTAGGYDAGGLIKVYTAQVV